MINKTFLNILLVIAVLLNQTVKAEDFPNKPITIVVGFGVGGSMDRMARAISKRLAEELGQPVQVINKKGAGTLLASNYILGRPHDGYTIYASSFSPYMTNSIINGNADFTIDDFAYLNFQWFDEELIALSKRSKYKNFYELFDALKTKPKTVKASCVRGSGGHLMTRILLEELGIPQENLNLVTYNSGGLTRAAVAGGVVDFTVVSATGSEGIREYINPLAIVSEHPNKSWGVPPLNDVLKRLNTKVTILPGSVRGFATSAEFKRLHPERFNKLVSAFKNILEDPELQKQLDQAKIGKRWTGPENSQSIMRNNFDIIKKYSYLLDY